MQAYGECKEGTGEMEDENEAVRSRNEQHRNDRKPLGEVFEPNTEDNLVHSPNTINLYEIQTILKG